VLIPAIILWVFAATVVALLPMRYQYVPGLVLLVAAPILIGAIGVGYGWIAGLLALAGFVSMFRHPLKYFYKRFRGTGSERQK